MNPFDLDDREAYRRWRDRKLAAHPERLEELVIEVDEPAALSEAEHGALQQSIQRCNMAIYASRCATDPDRERIRALGAQFGLRRLDQHLCADNDAISALTVTDDALHAGYVPYTNRPIAWHTDGYYHDQAHQIRGVILHCVRPASQGGTNQLMDHEIAYLLLREREPALVAALMHPLAMCIPANVMDGEELRPEVCGPVFSVDAGGHLHMRYTARTRSIRWRDDPNTQAAAAALREILDTPSPFRFSAALRAGQGLVCNNVLHTRSGFAADSPRLLYRARYFDHISVS